MENKLTDFLCIDEYNIFVRSSNEEIVYTVSDETFLAFFKLAFNRVLDKKQNIGNIQYLSSMYDEMICFGKDFGCYDLEEYYQYQAWIDDLTREDVELSDLDKQMIINACNDLISIFSERDLNKEKKNYLYLYTIE